MRSVINYKNTNEYLNQPLFFGAGLGLQRYDVQKHPRLEVLSKRQLSYFWIPEEFDLTKDVSDFADFSEGERHIFTSNLQYQILLDSVQGRAILQSLGQYASLPELESCLNIWQFFENIHSRSYTYIIKNVYTNPSAVFDDILTTKEILARALTVCEQYNKLINIPDTIEKKALYTSLYLTLVSTNILEGLRFYVSFACSFAFGELGRMLGSAKILSKIAQDENCHLQISQYLLNLLKQESDPLWLEVMQEQQSTVISMFQEAVNQEVEWANYLFVKGNMLGINPEILTLYVKWLCNHRLRAIGLESLYDVPTNNPIPWISKWLNSGDSQPAPQETELTSYLTGGGIDKTKTIELGDFSL